MSCLNRIEADTQELCVHLVEPGVRPFFRDRFFRSAPHLHGTDCFFGAVLEKPEAKGPMTIPKAGKRSLAPFSRIEAEARKPIGLGSR